MAVDTPATIAVIGAGPVGLEAALYARFLGYDVRVYERARIVEALQSNRAAPLPAAWRASASPLGMSALAAQQPGWQPPAAEAILSTGEMADLYYLPLAQSDLLVDSIATLSEVIDVERDLDPAEEPPAEDEMTGFRVRIRDADGERTEKADVVLDASGAAAPHWSVTRGEADFYVLGAKSAAARADFPVVEGLAQIRDLFTIIADRATLDLYATMAGPR